MEKQFNNAKAKLYNELTNTHNELQATQDAMQATQSSTVKPKKLDSFSGKGSVRSRIIHVKNYIGNEQNP